MLEVEPSIEVVDEAATHEEAVTLVLEHGPNVVLLDREMPGEDMGADEDSAHAEALSATEGGCLLKPAFPCRSARRCHSRGCRLVLWGAGNPRSRS